MSKGKIKQRNTYSSDTEVGTNYIKIVIILLAVFAIFYVITYLITKEPETPEAEPTIQYNEIIVGNMLNIEKEKYYVLVEFEDDIYNSLYETYLSKYSGTDDGEPYYTIDMSKGFNKSYMADKSNLDAESVSELKFSATTLLKIESGKIIEKYETNETIVSALEKLQKNKIQ